MRGLWRIYTMSKGWKWAHERVRMIDQQVVGQTFCNWRHGTPILYFPFFFLKNLINNLPLSCAPHISTSLPPSKLFSWSAAWIPVSSLVSPLKTSRSNDYVKYTLIFYWRQNSIVLLLCCLTISESVKRNRFRHRSSVFTHHTFFFS